MTTKANWFSLLLTTANATLLIAWTYFLNPLLAAILSPNASVNYFYHIGELILVKGNV
jgi:hypothetical protein